MGRFLLPLSLSPMGQTKCMARYEKTVLADKIFTPAQLESMRSEVRAEIDSAVEEAFTELPVVPSLTAETSDVYAPVTPVVETPPSSTKQKRRYIDALSDGLRQAMRDDSSIILMGQDIAEYGGVFKVTEGFLEEFGRDRVRNTPLCESGVIGCALGLAIEGFRPIVEMQFADFVSCGFNQIVDNGQAPLSGQAVPVIVRLPAGGGSGAGPFHSQSNEAWFTHTPGLKVVYPATHHDAKGLMLAAAQDNNPVIFFERESIVPKHHGGNSRWCVYGANRQGAGCAGG